jgi:hypothetical protein
MAGNQRCARPGCGGIATALLSYDYAGQRVWLDDPGVDAVGHHSALCAIHAGRMRPPIGWSCQDRRTGRSPAAPMAAPAPAPHVAPSEVAPPETAAPAIAV